MSKVGVRNILIDAGLSRFVCSPNTPLVSDALQAIGAARCIIVPINTRLTQAEVDYLLFDSESSIVLVDYQSAHLFSKATVPVIVWFALPFLLPSHNNRKVIFTRRHC
jgi:long-subunit acyl-CoA synthetase (AMP-forming)